MLDLWETHSIMACADLWGMSLVDSRPVVVSWVVVVVIAGMDVTCNGGSGLLPAHHFGCSHSKRVSRHLTARTFADE